jgi:Flp pilus assembly protein TadD
MTEKHADKCASVGVAKLETAKAARANIGGSASEHLAAGKQFLQDGQYNEAIAELSLAASLDPKLSEAHNLLGIAYNQKGFSDWEPKESFERAARRTRRR